MAETQDQVATALEALSDADLKRELQRRETIRKEARQKRHESHEETLKMVLSQITIDLLAPKHGRTSCSDEKPTNSFEFSAASSSGMPRCIRCGLLDLLNGNTLPDDLFLRVAFEVDKS